MEVLSGILSQCKSESHKESNRNIESHVITHLSPLITDTHLKSLQIFEIFVCPRLPEKCFSVNRPKLAMSITISSCPPLNSIPGNGHPLFWSCPSNSSSGQIKTNWSADRWVDSAKYYIPVADNKIELINDYNWYNVTDNKIKQPWILHQKVASQKSSCLRE